MRTLESPRNCSLLKETVRPFQISLGICQTNTTATTQGDGSPSCQTSCSFSADFPPRRKLLREPGLSLSLQSWAAFCKIMLGANWSQNKSWFWWLCVSALRCLSRLYHSLANFTTAWTKIAHFTVRHSWLDTLTLGGVVKSCRGNVNIARMVAGRRRLAEDVFRDPRNLNSL